MLELLGRIIEKHPWQVIITIILITIGFASLTPALEMETSTEDFMPDDEIVNASMRINEYFGGSSEMIMVFVERQNAQNVITPQALREEYRVLQDLDDKFDEVDGFISVAGFIDMICQIEFGDTLLNCTDDQIKIAYNDLVGNHNTEELKMMQIDDPNEKVDFNSYPKLSKGKSIDSLDIKNYYIGTTDEAFQFTIEVYDLSDFEDGISAPHRKINTWEWYIDFENLIVPDEMLADMNYQIAAHIEPSEPIWEVGKGLIKNIRSLLDTILNRELFKSYAAEAYLWIQAPGQDFSFPIALETGNVTFNTAENKIEIEVDRQELGKHGIAPKFGSFELPAKIGNTKSGVRIYQSQLLNQPWKRITVNLSYVQRLIESIQNRPVISSISEKILGTFGDFSWEDFDELFYMLNSGDLPKESLSLKDMSDSWTNLDEAPDLETSDSEYFVKPFFVEDLMSSVLMFLSQDFEEESGPSSTLMMVQLSDEIGSSGGGMAQNEKLDEISIEIESALADLDDKEDYVSMRATGNGIISTEMNEVTMEANMIIMPAIFIVICFILLIMFRRLSYVILPLVSLGISIIWLFGTMVLLGINFNMMMVAIVPLLMGLGVDYSVHLFHEYRSELKLGKKPGPAIIGAIQGVGMAMSLATLTTVIAFLSFLTATIPPLRDFGVLCALGIVYTLITALTLQASVRYILDRKKTELIKKNNGKISLDRFMQKFANIVLKQRKIILVLAVFITVLMASSAVQVGTTFDMNDFLPEGNEPLELMMDLGEFFPSSSESQEYILIEGDVASVKTLTGISKTYENLKDDEYLAMTPSGDPKEMSILSVIKNAVKANSSLASTFNIDSDGIPKTDSDVVRTYDYLYDTEEYMMDTMSVLSYNGNKYDATVIRIYTNLDYSDESPVDTNAQMGIVYDNLNEDLTSYGKADAIVTGMSSAMYVIMNSMTDSQILSTLVSIVLATLVLVIIYRRPTLGLIAIIPVGVSIVWIVGTIQLLGYSFNIMTIMVTSLTIGIGIDYAIHATQRFRLTADKTGDVEKAVCKTVGHTGGALFIAALTTAVGFGMLILAPMPPEQQFGVITSMTIIYSYITSIVILPPILMMWAKWSKKRKGYIISPKPAEKEEPIDDNYCD